MAAWEQAPEVGAAPAWASAPEVEAPKKPDEMFAQKLGRQVLNAGAGLVRGAGSIGATLLTPYDLIVGNTRSIGNPERRAAMDAGLQTLGADTDSLAFKGGKLGAEVAGTLGVGGGLAAGAKTLGASAPVVSALATGGLNAGGATGLGAHALRAGAGAVTGAATAGLIDPAAATTGAVVGAAAPTVVRGLGAAGEAVRKVISGPPVAPGVARAVEAAQDAGYVVPPTQARPTLVNRALEGAAGKISTAQSASARNQEVTNALVRRDLGLPEGAPISINALDDLRKDAGKAYAAVSRLGPLDATGAALPPSAGVTTQTNALMQRSTTADAADVVQAWRQANADATAYYRSYGRTADPETLTKARAAAAEANQLVNFLENSLEASGKTNLLDDLRAARVKIAKAHTAEVALNNTTGNVSAQKLAKEVAKGKKISGDMRAAADFATAFPKAAQSPEAMGSLPGVSPLDWTATMAGLIASGGSPASLGILAARPMARAAALSSRVQNQLATPAALNQLPLLDLEGQNALASLLVRAAPALVVGR